MKYLKFVFGENEIIVRIEKNLSFKEANDIFSAVEEESKKDFLRYDTDEMLVSSVLDEFDFDYEIIGIDYERYF